MSKVKIILDSWMYCEHHYRGPEEDCRDAVIEIVDSGMSGVYENDARYLCKDCARELETELLDAVKALEEDGLNESI